VGSGALSIAVYALADERDERFETVIGSIIGFAFILPVAFILASAAWLLFARRNASA
jgi:hypothetical protein